MTSFGCAMATVVALSSALAAEEKVTYQDQVMPILRNSCLGCHNPDKKKAGLDLSTYAAAMAGSDDSGAVVKPGDPSSSRLYKVVTHEEEPKMPQKAAKLPDKELEVFRKWIAQGALENSGSKVAVAKKSGPDLSLTTVTIGKPEGPPPMPAGLSTEPVVRLRRPGPLLSLAASPWAPVAAVGSQRQVLLYHTQTLDLLGVLPFPEGEPEVLRFSRNGKLLLAGGGLGAKAGKVVVWDVTSGKRITEVGDEYDAVLAADISSDQAFVALGGPSKALKLYSTADGQLLQSVKKHADWILTIAYSPDGNLLASGDRNGAVIVWEGKTARELFTLSGHKGAITSVAFRDDSAVLATASEDGTVKLWDMQSGSQIKSFNAHGGGVLCVAFGHDGRLVTCGRDHVAKLWGPDGSAQKAFEAFGDIALHATMTDDGARVIAGDYSGQIRVWNAADGKHVGDLTAVPLTLAERAAAAEKLMARLGAEHAKAAADFAAARDGETKARAELEAARGAGPKAVEAAQSAIRKAEESLKSAQAGLKAAQGALAEKQSAARRPDEQTGAARKKADDELVRRRKAYDEAAKESAAAGERASQHPDDAQLAEAAARAASAAAKASAELTGAWESQSAALEQVRDATAAAGKGIQSAKEAVEKQTAAVAAAKAQLNEATAGLAKAKAASAEAEKAAGRKADGVKVAAARASAAKKALDEVSAELDVVKGQVTRLKTASTGAPAPRDVH